jgi:hypothetical protein
LEPVTKNGSTAPPLAPEPVTNPGQVSRTALLIQQGERLEDFTRYMKAAGAVLTLLATLVGGVVGVLAWATRQQENAAQAAKVEASRDVEELGGRVDGLEQRVGRIEDKQDRAADKLDAILMRLPSRTPRKKEEAVP